MLTFISLWSTGDTGFTQSPCKAGAKSKAGHAHGPLWRGRDSKEATGQCSLPDRRHENRHPARPFRFRAINKERRRPVSAGVRTRNMKITVPSSHQKGTLKVLKLTVGATCTRIMEGESGRRSVQSLGPSALPAGQTTGSPTTWS